MCIREILTVKEPENNRGDFVAATAFGRDVFQGEIAASEIKGFLPFPDLFCQADAIRDGVLSVGIGSDDAGDIRKIVQNIFVSRFQGHALAVVHIMVQDNGPVDPLNLFENRLIGLAASVVDDDNVAEAAFRQLLNIRRKPFIRLQRGNQNDRFAHRIGNVLFLTVHPFLLPVSQVINQFIITETP